VVIYFNMFLCKLFRNLLLIYYLQTYLFVCYYTKKKIPYYILQGTNYEEFDSSCVFQLAHAGQNPLIFCSDTEQLAKRYA